MSFDLKVMKEPEQKYTYRQSTQIAMQCGLIGYLRADMDTNGKGFFSSWNDYRKDLKTDEFKAEFDDLINTYRQKDNFLADRNTLSKFCYKEALQYGSDERSFGVRIDSDDYAYLCRLNPHQGEYNLYCYCYKKEWLDDHIRNAEKGIRFITPEYKERFRIKDGDRIRITYSDGKICDMVCRYIDEYHVEVGDNLYHICEFAERIEQNSAKVIPLRSDLPETCYANLPGTDEVIIIKRGESGYYTCEYSLEEESETYLGIYSVMAQSESENISSNVKWGITKRMQNGTYSCRFNFLGYRKDKGESEPRIIPEEAEIVRHIFKMYVEGGSIDQIKAYLEGNHIKTVQGKDTWDKTVIRHMLQNEKYVGDVLYQKTFRTDCISKHTKINRGERTKYLVSNNHPAIIDRETFKAVQSEMVRRSSKRKTSDFAITNLGKYSGKYALSELLVCGECGSLYKRKTWTKGGEKRIYWRCQNRIEHGSKYCKKSKGIEEKRLHETICRALRKMVEESASVISLIKADLAYGLSGDEGTYDVGALEKSISDATTDLNDYMKQYNNTGGDKTKYIECIQQTSEKIRLLRIELDTAKAKIAQNEKINQEVERLTKWLTEHDISFESYDDVVVRRMVELIRVNNDNTITVFSKFGSEVVENL